MPFTAHQLATPLRHYPPHLHSIVRFGHPTFLLPLLSHLLLKFQFSAIGPDLLLHRCLPLRYMHILPLLQPTAHTQHHLSIGLRCAGRLLIFNAVPLRRCDLQFPDAGLPALSYITLNSQIPLLPDPHLSLSFPLHLPTTAPLTFLDPSLLHPLAFLLEILTTLQLLHCTLQLLCKVQTPYFSHTLSPPLIFSLEPPPLCIYLPALHVWTIPSLALLHQPNHLPSNLYPTGPSTMWQTGWLI